MDMPIQTERVSSFAGASHLAVDDELRRESDVRPNFSSADINPVCERTGRSKGPASSTVLGNMLISGDRHIICVRDISPIPKHW